jgi:hypothetical protein
METVSAWAHARLRRLPKPAAPAAAATLNVTAAVPENLASGAHLYYVSGG